jgi:hypothetical protein
VPERYAGVERKKSISVKITFLKKHIVALKIEIQKLKIGVLVWDLKSLN